MLILWANTAEAGVCKAHCSRHTFHGTMQSGHLCRVVTIRKPGGSYLEQCSSAVCGSVGRFKFILRTHVSSIEVFLFLESR
jgi:hypothetical protein